MVATLLIGLLSMALHELAHVTAAGLLGATLKRFGMSWKGAYIVREAGTPAGNLIITLSGPLANLLLACAWPLSHQFAMVNLLFGLTNLLQIQGSDGERAWMLLARRGAPSLSLRVH